MSPRRQSSDRGERRGRRVRWLRRLAWSAFAGVFAFGISLVPAALREFDGTRVRRVEVLGVHYLGPQEALTAAGIGAGSSIFDRARAWRTSLLEHPLVADVEIRRRLPATVILAVREVEPVALVRTPELQVVDVHGRVLPIEPWRRDVDLPVLRPATSIDARGHVSNPEVLGLLAELARIAATVPDLSQHISELHALREGEVRLLLRTTQADALLPAGPEPERLRRLGVILADLAARSELDGVRRIDARFQGQFVVAFNPRTGS